ncbi:MAG: glycosyl transferase, group 1 [uncultured bacterium]|nr:MAG: glycosyl transferase, group 1 [uncultured bacterium]
MFSKMQKKPKVAFIHPAVGESLGGSQVFVLELAQRLKDKCDITIFSAKRENDLCKPVFSLSRRNKKYGNSFLYNILHKALSKQAATPDIVIEHITSFFPLLFRLLFGKYDVIFPNNDWGGLLVASAVRQIKGTSIMFTEHNGYLERGKIAARNLKFKPNKYIALSEEFKFWVKKYYPDIDVKYIPNGVDFDKFNPEGTVANIDLPGPIILTAARYQRNKRLELVIDAVANLNQGSLLVLTSGDNIESLNQYGKHNLGDRFKLMSVPYDEMPSYYRACDVFTLPSMYEPFGLVYLEAMACNKPVVAPDDLSRTDIVGDAGILCDVSDIEEYANSLKIALNGDFADIPYNQARKYTWQKCSEQYYKVIKSLISAN